MWIIGFIGFMGFIGFKLTNVAVSGLQVRSMLYGLWFWGFIGLGFGF